MRRLLERKYRWGWMLLALAAAAGLLSAATAQEPEQETAFPAHRVGENLYFVGSKYTAAYLVTTDQGHILINSGFAETVPLIQASVRKLGFRFEDIKILLDSHAHNDHVAGHALVRRLTGAKVLVMEGDEEIIRTGGKGDFQYDAKWEPCPVDRVLHDKDTVTLGKARLTARKTPGHTRGCTTWTLEVPEGGKKRLAVIIGSPNVNPGYRLVNNPRYPAIAKDYARTFQVLKSLPCQLFLGAHGVYYDMEAKYARWEKDQSRNPFIDPEGYRRYVNDREAAYKAELAKQQAEK